MTTETRAPESAETLLAVSRALYRRLAPHLTTTDRSVRQRVLDACETTTRRLESEPHFARPGRYLFEEIRTLFPITEQLWVRRTVEIHIALAKRLIERTPPSSRQCSAFTRSSTPCRREPLPGNDYCPSHRHLEAFHDPGPTPAAPPPAKE